MKNNKLPLEYQGKKVIKYWKGKGQQYLVVFDDNTVNRYRYSDMDYENYWDSFLKKYTLEELFRDYPAWKAWIKEAEFCDLTETKKEEKSKPFNRFKNLI